MNNRIKAFGDFPESRFLQDAVLEKYDFYVKQERYLKLFVISNIIESGTQSFFCILRNSSSVICLHEEELKPYVSISLTEYIGYGESGVDCARSNRRICTG